MTVHFSGRRPGNWFREQLSIRDPYIFEFLGLKPREAVAESDLEQALLENLQEFLLELGHGFCLDARQKNIVIPELAEAIGVTQRSVERTIKTLQQQGRIRRIGRG
jgi:DNA-binding MarR family transcriptional regulator